MRRMLALRVQAATPPVPMQGFLSATSTCADIPQGARRAAVPATVGEPAPARRYVAAEASAGWEGAPSVRRGCTKRTQKMGPDLRNSSSPRLTSSSTLRREVGGEGACV